MAEALLFCEKLSVVNISHIACVLEVRSLVCCCWILKGQDSILEDIQFMKDISSGWMKVVAWQESLTTTERARNSVGLRSTDTTIYDWGWLNWVNILLRPCMKWAWQVPGWGSLCTRTLSGTGGWWRRRTRTWRSSSPRSRRTPPTGAPAGWSGSSRCSETCQNVRSRSDDDVFRTSEACSRVWLQCWSSLSWSSQSSLTSSLTCSG